MLCSFHTAWKCEGTHRLCYFSLRPWGSFFSPRKSHWSQIILRLEWGWASLTFSVQIWERIWEGDSVWHPKDSFLPWNLVHSKADLVGKYPAWAGQVWPLDDCSLRRCPSWRRITALYKGQVKYSSFLSHLSRSALKSPWLIVDIKLGIARLHKSKIPTCICFFSP